MTGRKIQYWVIPPDANAEFVASMEEVLETYEQPYDPNLPVLCMDEQLLGARLPGRQVTRFLGRLGAQKCRPGGPAWKFSL